MYKTLYNHLISIIFVGSLFIIIQLLFPNESLDDKYSDFSSIQTYTGLDFLDLNSPEDRQLLREALEIYDPLNTSSHDSLLTEIEQYLTNQMRASAGSRELSQGVDGDKLISLLFMMIKFALIYILVLLITYYGVETFALYRFVHDKYRLTFMKSIAIIANKLAIASDFKSKSIYLIKIVGKIGRIVMKSVITLILFAPAYVIAYSFKTRFDTESIILMVILAVISNGLLITYTQKYYTFLVSESRKGYVQTAKVKNLDARYTFDKENGISLSSIFRFKKTFPGHILDQIYENVRFQYLTTLKEQASFLITGLIIIEMALNIQGHLCYELMQNILYKNVSVVLIILFGIFLIVKLTQIVIDSILIRHHSKIGNIILEETG